MEWPVEIGDEFESEFYELDEDVRTEILAHSRLLRHFGPQLGRPVLIRSTVPATQI